MIIKCISDTHNDHHMLDSNSLSCDILIHCGDFGTKGNYSEAISFLNWFVKQPAKYKLLVPGNHDKRIKTNYELKKLANDYNIKLLMNNEITIEGYKFYGAHFTCSVKNGVYGTTYDVRESAWKGIPEDTDILITHMPPHGILDTNQEGEHIGCDMLTQKVKEIKPMYHLFGHVHEHSYENENDGDTIFINCAMKNRQYLLIRNTPIGIKLEDRIDITSETVIV